MNRILIIQTAFIGDVVLATSLVEKLHRYFPDARIDFLLRKGNEQLLLGHPFINKLIIWDKKKNKKRNLFRILAEIRKNRYDILINVQRFFATGLIASFSGAKRTIGFDKNPLSFLFSNKIVHQVGGNQAQHEVQRNQKLIADLTDNQYCLPRLYPTAADFSFVETWSQGDFITISPASVWFTKQYPASQWSSFIKKIPETCKIFLLGGPDDVSLCNDIYETCPGTHVKILAGKLSFLQSAALMSYSQMNYVNDSAPMHFASAMNAPVTAIYCSTVPEFGFGPLSDIRHIVEVKEKLYCRPCGLHGYASCPEKHFRCAMDVQVGQLTETLPKWKVAQTD